MKKTNISEVIKQIDSLVNDKFLIVTADKYVAVMNDKLWEQFDTVEKQHTLLRNLLLYCNFKNAYSGIDYDKNHKLQLVVKNELKLISLRELENGKVKYTDF